MRAALLLLATLLAVPPLAVGGGNAAQAFAAGLGKTYDPVQCYAPATQEMVIDHGDGTVYARTVNPCGLVPLGATVFEHTYSFADCAFLGISVWCEAFDADGHHIAYLGSHPHLPPPAVSMLYLIERDHEHWTETLAAHGLLLSS